MNMYHEILQLTQPLSDERQSTENSELRTSIFSRLREEGKTLHEGKHIAPQLPAFATDYDVSALNQDQKVQLIVELLLPYKSTFGRFISALEWACTTSKFEVADIIINHYLDLVKAGSAVWEAPAEEVQVALQTLGYTTNIFKLQYLRSENNSLPDISFGAYPLPSDLTLCIFSYQGWYKNLLSCACVNREWNHYFNLKKTWLLLYACRWDSPNRDLGAADWKEQYIKRCSNHTFWEGMNEKLVPPNYDWSKAQTLHICSEFLRSVTAEKLVTLSKELESACKQAGKAYFEYLYVRRRLDIDEEDLDKIYELENFDEKRLLSYANKLERALRYSYVTQVISDTKSIPSRTRLDISLYDFLPKPEPCKISVICSSGQRGGSYSSDFCIEMDFKLDDFTVLVFDRNRLMKKQFDKYGYSLHDYLLFSEKCSPVIDIPVRLITALCLSIFPPTFTKQLHDHYLRGSGSLSHAIS
eukprot:Phypoly_transcript_07921.p1 GENE.Phypoly_transcript_07921~~Phypoly_transcript_07921.p1  ORF type:complete len:512 (+),score=70.72 Phypoly_transcript_07921:126-1538(+)